MRSRRRHKDVDVEEASDIDESTQVTGPSGADRARMPWTDDEEERLLRLKRSKKSNREIATALNRSVDSIASRFRSLTKYVLIQYVLCVGIELDAMVFCVHCMVITEAIKLRRPPRPPTAEIVSESHQDHWCRGGNDLD